MEVKELFSEPSGGFWAKRFGKEIPQRGRQPKKLGVARHHKQMPWERGTTWGFGQSAG